MLKVIANSIHLISYHLISIAEKAVYPRNAGLLRPRLELVVCARPIHGFGEWAHPAQNRPIRGWFARSVGGVAGLPARQQ